MPKVIHIQPKKRKEPLYWLHNCACGLFKLRDDGRIICDKCKADLGWWSLDAYDNPQKPL